MATSGAAARRSITGLHTALKDYKKTKLPENVQKAADDLLKKIDATCLKLGTPVQCGQPAPGLGWAGPPVVYTPPPVTQRITQLLGGIENYAAAPPDYEDRSRSVEQNDAGRERAVCRGAGRRKTAINDDHTDPPDDGRLLCGVGRRCLFDSGNVAARIGRCVRRSGRRRIVDGDHRIV